MKFISIFEAFPKLGNEVLVSNGQDYKLATIEYRQGCACWIDSSGEDFDYEDEYVFWTEYPKVSKRAIKKCSKNKRLQLHLKKHQERQIAKIEQEKQALISYREAQIQEERKRKIHEELTNSVLEELKDPKYQRPTAHEKAVSYAKYKMYQRTEELKLRMKIEEDQRKFDNPDKTEVDKLTKME
jgi:hypothetical protein